MQFTLPLTAALALLARAAPMPQDDGSANSVDDSSDADASSTKLESRALSISAFRFSGTLKSDIINYTFNVTSPDSTSPARCFFSISSSGLPNTFSYDKSAPAGVVACANNAPFSFRWAFTESAPTGWYGWALTVNETTPSGTFGAGRLYPHSAQYKLKNCAGAPESSCNEKLWDNYALTSETEFDLTAYKL